MMLKEEPDVNQIVRYASMWNMAGKHLLEMGHTKIMYMANVDEDCDHDRYLGLTGAYAEKGMPYQSKDYKVLSPIKEERQKRFEEIIFFEEERVQGDYE